MVASRLGGCSLGGKGACKSEEDGVGKMCGIGDRNGCGGVGGGYGREGGGGKGAGGV